MVMKGFVKDMGRVFTETQTRISLFLALPWDKLWCFELERQVRDMGTQNSSTDINLTAS